MGSGAGPCLRQTSSERTGGVRERRTQGVLRKREGRIREAGCRNAKSAHEEMRVGGAVVVGRIMEVMFSRKELPRGRTIS